MDSLVTLLIFAAFAALSAWIKRKQNADQAQETEDEQAPPNTSPGRPAPPPAVQWEQELRRMLGQAEPAPAPPPLPRAAPPALPHLAPPVSAAPREAKPTFGLLERASAGQQRALTLEQRVNAQLHHGSGNPAVVSPSAQATGHDHALIALQLLRQRSSLRALVIGSLVLGPPKALEDEKKI